MIEAQEMKHTPERYPDKAMILSAVDRMHRAMSGEAPPPAPRAARQMRKCLVCGEWIGRCKNEKRNKP